MSFIEEGAALAGKVLAGVVVAIACIMIISAGVNWYLDNREILHASAENVVEQIPVICGLEEQISTQLTKSWVDYLEDDKARFLAQKILDGEKLSTCEWHEFIDHLNEWEKRKLRIYDLVCDLSACLQ